jgi:hypothetical protein
MGAARKATQKRPRSPVFGRIARLKQLHATTAQRSQCATE